MIDPLHQDNTRDERKLHGQRSKGAWFIQTGLKVWMIDPKTEKPEEVKPTMARVVDKKLGGDLSIKQTVLKVELNPLFFYVKAINQKNALRKYYKSQFYAKIKRDHEAPGNPS